MSKYIPKTARGKADRLRTKYQKRAGIDSHGIGAASKGKTQVADWRWSMNPKNPLYDQIKEDVKLLGGAVFKGGSVGGGFYDYYAAFTTHK